MHSEGSSPTSNSQASHQMSVGSLDILNFSRGTKQSNFCARQSQVERRQS